MLKADLSTASKHSVGKRIAANTGLMVGSKFLAVLLGIGSLSIATKSLDGWAFGTLVFLHAYMLFFSEIGTFQSWQSIIRFGSDDLKEKNCSRLGQLLNFSIKLDALAATIGYLTAMGVFAGVVYIGSVFPGIEIGGSPGVATGGGRENGGSAHKMQLSDVQGYAALYCLLILFRQRGTSIGVFRLFDKFNVLAIKALIMPFVRFIGAVIAAITGAGFEGFLLAWFLGSFTAYIYLPVMALLEIRKRRLWSDVWSAKIKFFNPRAGLWPFAIKSNIDSTLAAANQHLPALLVTAVFGPVWVGVYKIAEEFAKLLSEGFKLLDQVIYPELAKLVSAGEADKIWQLVTRAALILLSFGVFMSCVFLWIGPDLLALLTTQDYTPAVPLASLLVPAAALMGTAAPLYPIFYAADKPHRAIYARGAGVLIYIISFFILSFTIGRMAPGWAAILGNASAVLLVVVLARQTLKTTVLAQNKGQGATLKPGALNDSGDEIQNIPSMDVPRSVTPSVRFVSKSAIKIWGLDMQEWQSRAFKKAGADMDSLANDGVVIDINWVLSAGLSKALIGAPMTALIVDGIVIATHGVDDTTAVALIGRPVQASKLTAIGLKIQTPSELAGSYNKALRKSEAPYALNVSQTSVSDIMKRQFSSSYKGITDFVTKFFWPLPAYYVTRLCAYWRLTPNMVTTIGLVLMFAALYYFSQGQWVLGFVTGWIMTFLDTVDGKLARTTMTYSAWGNIYDHGIDLIHPPFWYTAWFFGLGGVLVWPEVMTLALAAIWVGYVVDRLIEGIFIAQHGFHIHVWRPINSFMRFITARRNPNMFIFMIGIILSAIWPVAALWGFYAVAIWTWVCIVFNIGVVIYSNLTRRPVVSWMETDTETPSKPRPVI